MQTQRQAFAIELPDSDQLTADKTGSGIASIGYGRVLPHEYAHNFDLSRLAWRFISNGQQAASVTVHTPNAKAVRLQVDLKGLLEQSELRFFRPVTQTIVSIKQIQLPAGLYWSPIIEGDSIGFEIILSAQINPADVQFALPLLSHFFHDSSSLKIASSAGKAGPCQRNAACQLQAVPASIVYSVARIRFTWADGSSHLCTATMLNDTDPNTFIPYLLTANHCVSDAATADSIEVDWFWQSNSCDGEAPTDDNRQRGGTKLLFTDSGSDYTLLQLNTEPPAGVGFAGWSTDALHLQNNLIGIHHPRGDIKKMSWGLGQRYVAEAGSGSDELTYLELGWDEGTTEPGSSGSGLWAQRDSQWYFIGALSGGGSSCEVPNAPDYYGRFDLVYPKMARFLDPPPQPNLDPVHLFNISTNLMIDTEGANADFIVNGAEALQLIVMGESSALDAVLSLTDLISSKQLNSNDNWQDHATANQVSSVLRDPKTVTDAAFLVTTPPGLYVATLTDKQGRSGQGIVSITQAELSSNSHILNISTQGRVGEQGAIVGFIVSGTGERRFVIMAENAGSLADPVLAVTNFERTQTFASNDNWQDHATVDEVVAKLRAPASTKDAALALSLPQGVYLAIMTGKNGSTGRGIISVTEVSQ